MMKRGQAYDYSDGEMVFEAYVTGGDQRRRPAVVLAHEWSGLNAAMREVAERIAALGYVCFALDLYGKGLRGDEAGDNHHLMGPLMEDRTLLRRRLLAGLSVAQQHPSVDPSRIAALGYCFGGLCVLDMARANPKGLAGVVSVHGGLKPPGLEPTGPIGASVLVLHGWEDPITPAQDVLAFATEMTRAGADWQMHAYGHAMHAFTAKGLNVPDQGLAYNRLADARSWQAMRNFFDETIGAPMP